MKNAHLESSGLIDGKPVSFELDLSRLASAKLDFSRRAKWLLRNTASYDCGTSALATLLPVSERSAIVKARPRRGYWEGREITQFLRRRGVETFQLTRNVLCARHSMRGLIKPNHVLLVGAWTTIGGEGTWHIIHKGRDFHGFWESPLDPLEFLNYPLDEAHIVYQLPPTAKI